MILLRRQKCNFISKIAKINTHTYDNIFLKNIVGGGSGGALPPSPTMAPSMRTTIQKFITTCPSQSLVGFGGEDQVWLQVPTCPNKQEKNSESTKYCAIVFMGLKNHYINIWICHFNCFSLSLPQQHRDASKLLPINFNSIVETFSYFEKKKILGRMSNICHYYNMPISSST